MDVMKSTNFQFVNQALPMVLCSESLGHFVSEHPEFDEKVKSAYLVWSHQVRENLAQIEGELSTDYNMIELEALRLEICSCIIHGHYQGAVCLTSILLEAFLKLALVYTNWNTENRPYQPFDSLTISESDPAAGYLRQPLKVTIDTAQNQGLIDEDTAVRLHTCREQIRNAFFHADMEMMRGDQTSLFVHVDFCTGRIEGPTALPIANVPLVMGEEMWQTARVNAIPYFKQVDGLIRETLPKVFPGINEDQTENMNE